MDGGGEKPVVAQTPWLVWQLADSAFPTGGFAHSNGLEAAWQLGRIDFDAYLDQAVWQVGRQALPFVRAAALEPERIDALDALCDATLTNHVANRASRAQGRALWSTATRVFAEDARLLRHAERMRATAMHHAPVFGLAMASLGLDEVTAQSLYLHLSLRGTLSAGVRLGIVGPLEAQSLHTERAPLLDRVLAGCRGLPPEESAQSSPLADLYATLHDDLYAKLFQS